MMRKDEMVCNICQQEILSDDDYLMLETYKYGLFSSRGYYHEDCYREKIKMNKKVMGKANAMLEDMGKMLGGIKT